MYVSYVTRALCRLLSFSINILYTVLIEIVHINSFFYLIESIKNNISEYNVDFSCKRSLYCSYSMRPGIYTNPMTNNHAVYTRTYIIYIFVGYKLRNE